MEKADHRKSHNTMTGILRYFGIWNTVYESSGFRGILYIIYTIIMISMMPIFSATIAAELYDHTDNLVMMTYDILFLTSVSLVLIKLFFFHLHRKHIVDLIGDVYLPVDILMSSSERPLVSLLKYHALWARAQDCLCGGLGALLLIALIFLMPTEEGHLPIEAKFPFDYTEQPMYTVAFVLQVVGLVNTVATLFSLDSFILHICRWTSVQLEVLNSNFQHCQPHWQCSQFESILKDIKLNLMNESDNEITSFIPFSIDDSQGDQAFIKRFEICISHHRRIIDIVEKINDLFGTGMLIQLGCYLLIICLAGFQCLFGATGTDALVYVIVGGAAMFNVGVWCFYGNNLLFQSIGLMNSQWFSGWEEELTSDVKCLLTMSLARTKKTLELKAGNFYQLSMETYIMIIKTTYSAFALLATMMDETEA